MRYSKLIHRAFLLLSLFLCAFSSGRFGSANGEPPATHAGVEHPDKEITSHGIFSSDRGDFPYIAQYWPDDGASQDPVGKKLLENMKQVAISTSFEELAAAYSRESLAGLEPERAVMAGENLKGRTDDKVRQITHLVMIEDADKSDLYFARVTMSFQMPMPAGSSGHATSRVVVLNVLYAFRGRGGEIKIDLPARENPVFEAMNFGEWDRFGLPAPKARGLQQPTTQPVPADSATTAETDEMMELRAKLDPATEIAILSEVGKMPNLSDREATLLIIIKAKQILSTRPSTEPTKP